MLIDPHVNPKDLSPDELIDKMIEASMDGAVITCTHSALNAVPYIKALLDDEFVCYVGVELCTARGELLFIPETADKIKICLGKSYAKCQWPSVGKNFASAFDKVEVGAKFNPIENLFKKIEDNYVLELEKQFGGRDN